jgi:hypothetical protein
MDRPERNSLSKLKKICWLASQKNIFFNCFVYAYFIFDENDKLIEIVVRKDWDVM